MWGCVRSVDRVCGRRRGEVLGVGVRDVEKCWGKCGGCGELL